MERGSTGLGWIHLGEHCMVCMVDNSWCCRMVLGIPVVKIDLSPMHCHELISLLSPMHCHELI